MNIAYKYHTRTCDDGTIEVDVKENNAWGSTLYSVKKENIDTFVEGSIALANMDQTAAFRQYLDLSNEGTDEERVERCIRNYNTTMLHLIVQSMTMRYTSNSPSMNDIPNMRPLALMNKSQIE